MRRYTGQKALYEAISRSRAKAKHGSILEKLRSETTRPEIPAAPEGQPQVGSVETPAEPPRPDIKESPRPPVEKPVEPVVVRENARLRRLTTGNRVAMSPEKPVPPTKPDRSEKADEPAPAPGPVRARWQLKPLQLNAGRVEVAVPYHIGVVVALVAILVVLASFRMGQRYSGPKSPAPVSAKAPVRAAKQNAETPQATPAAASSSAGEPVLQGDHWIVLKQYRQKADLDAVKEYFGRNGIDLLVVSVAEVRTVFAERELNAAVLPKGDGFLLVTSNLYSNPENPGTDGYKMKQKIIEVGKDYKAPSGKETFAPMYFQDAYGMRISKVK